jgi:chromate transporter
MAADAQPAVAPVRPTSLLQLFLVFSGLALRGFGGVLPWAQRVLVEERQWLSREEFLETLAFGQLLPGPNVCNVAIMVGDRWFGWRGSVTALAGMLAAPLALVLIAISLYGQVSDEPILRHALAGMGAVAGGLFMATAVKLALGARRQWQWLGFGLLAFVGLAAFRIPMALLMLGLAPVAVGAALWAQRRQARVAASRDLFVAPDNRGQNANDRGQNANERNPP